MARRQEGGRLISKAHSGAIEPGSAPVPRSFPRVGAPPPPRSVSWRLGAAPPPSLGGKRGPPRARLPSLWRGWLRRGRASCGQWPPLLCGSSRLQIGRPSGGQGPSCRWQTWASPEAPRAAQSPRPRSPPSSAGRRNPPEPRSLRGAAMCLCTVSTLQYLPNPSFVPTHFPFLN